MIFFDLIFMKVSPNLMSVLKGRNMLQLRKMEVKVLKLKTEKVRKLARGNVNQMMTAKMRENFAFVMVPVACHASDLKENVLNYLTLLMDKFILQEGWFFIERNTLTIYFIPILFNLPLCITALQDPYPELFSFNIIFRVVAGKELIHSTYLGSFTTARGDK